MLMQRTARHIILHVSLLLAIFSSAHATTIDDFTFYASTHPPLSFEQNKKASGIAIDIFFLMLEKMQAQKGREDIVFVNWTRAYNQTLTRPNSILIDAYRTEERENLFKWVGPFMTAQPSLIARQADRIEIVSTADFDGYIIGTLRHDATEQLLMQTSVSKENIIHLSSPDHLAKLLTVGRVDLWAYDWLPAIWVLEKHGYDPARYEPVWTLGNPEHYFAFHKSAGDTLIEEAQRALQQLINNGSVSRIIQRYIPQNSPYKSQAPVN